MNQIQCRTHQVLTNQNSRTEMNRQLGKIETPHNQTTHNQTTRANINIRTKSKSRKLEENYERGKGLPSLGNIEWRTVKTETKKVNQVLPYISTNNITELNELISARAKLVCEKIGIHEEKFKTRMGNSTGNANRNLRKQVKMIKQRKDTGTCRDKKEKATQRKIKIQLEEINQKVVVKKGRLKRYRQRVK